MVWGFPWGSPGPCPPAGSEKLTSSILPVLLAREVNFPAVNEDPDSHTAGPGSLSLPWPFSQSCCPSEEKAFVLTGETESRAGAPPSLLTYWLEDVTAHCSPPWVAFVGKEGEEGRREAGDRERARMSLGDLDTIPASLFISCVT